jgi:hypothetical protein
VVAPLTLRKHSNDPVANPPPNDQPYLVVGSEMNAPLETGFGTLSGQLPEDGFVLREEKRKAVAREPATVV